MKETKRLVPKRRFKEFKHSEEWGKKKLLDLAEFNPKEELPISFKYIDLESVVGTSLISYKEEDRETAPSRAQRLARQGDVFYQTVRPYQKNNYLFTKPCKNYVFSTGYTQMRPSGDSFFLLSLIQNNRFLQLALDRCTGTSYPAISSNNLTEIEVISPDYKEQTKIGQFFKQLDNLINLQQDKIKKVKAIKSAYLSDLFPKEGEKYPKLRFKGFTEAWEEYMVKDVCSITTGKSNTQDQTDDGVYPFFIRSEVPVKSNKYLYDCEAVITIGDGKIGSVFHYVNGKFDLHQRCYKMADFNKVLGRYFYYYFSTKFYDRAMKMTAKATVDSVRLEMISDMDISYPQNISEQKLISRFLENLDKQITLHEKKLEKLENLKKAYLNEMFV